VTASQLSELTIPTDLYRVLNEHQEVLSLLSQSTCQLQVFDLVTLKRIVKLAGHKGLVYDISWSPDDTCIVTCGSDATAKMWDLVAARETLAARAQSEPGAAARSGSRAALSHTATLHAHDKSAAAAASVDSASAAATVDAGVDTHDTPLSSRPFCTVLRHASFVYSCAFYPYLRHSSTHRVHDGSDSAPGGSNDFTPVSPNSQPSSQPSSQQQVDPATGSIPHTLDAIQPALQRLIATGCCDGNAYLWDADAAYTPLCTINVVPQLRGMQAGGVNTVRWDCVAATQMSDGTLSSLLYTGVQLRLVALPHLACCTSR
jgi:WD40 repeat protein